MFSPSQALQLEGYDLGNAQVWGTVRLIPVLNRSPYEALRLNSICVDSYASVALAHSKSSQVSEAYHAYIPHAFIARVEDEEQVAFGTKLSKPQKSSRQKGGGWIDMKRMAKKTSDGLRFLPLHFAMEGYLALHFGGPDVAWEEYSRAALRDTLSPRMEAVIHGWSIPNLGNALNVFEIHEQQVGMMLFVGDVLATVFIVPNSTDYRLLHRSLLMDFLGDVFIRHAINYPEVPEWDSDLKPVGEVETIDDIRKALDARERDWSEFGKYLLNLSLGGNVSAKKVHKIGPFSLYRFLPDFDLEAENHIGEMIVDSAGRIAYLKTFRLTQAQIRRGYLLKMLAENDWSIPEAAKQSGDSVNQLYRRIVNAGFGYFLNGEILRKLT